MLEMAGLTPAGFGNDVDTAGRREVGVHSSIHGGRHGAQVQLSLSIDATPRKAAPHVENPASKQHLPLSSRPFSGLSRERPHIAVLIDRLHPHCG